MMLQELNVSERHLFIGLALLSITLSLSAIFFQVRPGIATTLVIILLYISMYRKYIEFHLKQLSRARLSLVVHVVSIILVGASGFAL